MSARLSGAGAVFVRDVTCLPRDLAARRPLHHRGPLPGGLQNRAYEPSLPSYLFLVAVFHGSQ